MPVVGRDIYRSATYSELCHTCRAPTWCRCFECRQPVCVDHAHLHCQVCNQPAMAACLRCGHGVCSEHVPMRRDRRCPVCEEQLWQMAASSSAGTAPAQASDFGAITGLLGGSVLVASTMWLPVVSGTLALTAVAWPALKMGYIAARRSAMVEQLRPDFLHEHHPSRVLCLAGCARDEEQVAGTDPSVERGL